MLYHLTNFGELPERIRPVTSFGSMGVDLFFVLSGFLIGQQLLKSYVARRKISVAEFYRRRAFRILPSYLVVLALYYFVPWWREFPPMAPLWKFLTFTMNFGSRGGAFSHAWSLCVEEHFYLLLPLLILLLMRRPSTRKTVAIISAFVVLGIGLRTFLIVHYPDSFWARIYFPSYTRLDGLLVGVSLATVRSYRPSWWSALMRRGHSLSLLGVLCIGSAMWFFGAYDFATRWGLVFEFPLIALGFGLLTASSVSDNGLLSRVKVPGTELLATLAFTLYLTHKAVAKIVMRTFPAITSPQGPASWLLYAFTCMAAAWLLHVSVELPFLRLRDRPARRSMPALEAEARGDPAL